MLEIEQTGNLTWVHAVGRYAVGLQSLGQIFAVEDIGQLGLAVSLGGRPALGNNSVTSILTKVAKISPTKCPEV